MLASHVLTKKKKKIPPCTRIGIGSQLTRGSHGLHTTSFPVAHGKAGLEENQG